MNKLIKIFTCSLLLSLFSFASGMSRAEVNDFNQLPDKQKAALLHDLPNVQEKIANYKNEIEELSKRLETEEDKDMQAKINMRIEELKAELNWLEDYERLLLGFKNEN